MLYYFGGVNGAGKSSLIARIAEQPGFQSLQLTERLISFMGLTSREELRQLPQAENRKQLARLMDRLAIESVGQNHLIDAHFLNLRRGRVSKVVGAWIEKMDALVVVTADPSTIHDRITQDSRDRALLAKALPATQYIARLDRYQKQTIAEAERLASQYNLPVLILDNQDLDRAADRFFDFHQKISHRADV